MDNTTHHANGNGNGNGTGAGADPDPGVIVPVVTPYVSQEDFVAAAIDEAPSVMVPSAEGVTTYAGGENDPDDLTDKRLTAKLDTIPGKQNDMLAKLEKHRKGLVTWLPNSGNGIPPSHGSDAHP